MAPRKEVGMQYDEQGHRRLSMMLGILSNKGILQCLRKTNSAIDEFQKNKIQRKAFMMFGEIGGNK